MTYAHPPARVVPLYFAISRPEGPRLQDLSPSNNVAFIAANRAHYVPFVVPDPFIVDKFRWRNGSVVSGNADAGIYSSDGTRLVSTGSTAQSGASAIQEVDVTDTYLAPGVYYSAFTASNTSGSYVSFTDQGITEIGRSYGLFQQSSALPLPSSATFAAWTSQTWVSLFVKTKTVGS